jgi:hypothetical protein
MDGDMCTGNERCRYGDVACACVAGMGMRRRWRCGTIPDAAQDPGCPVAMPTSGTSCADAGAGQLCRYGQGMICFCDQQEQWACF